MSASDLPPTPHARELCRFRILELRHVLARLADESPGLDVSGLRREVDALDARLGPSEPTGAHPESGPGVPSWR
jgi:hypothetical protein